MTQFPEGNAIVYCEGAFGTTNGKTAHGLVRRTARYRVLSVVDSRCCDRDAGQLLDNRTTDIPVVSDVATAIENAAARGHRATHLVIGLAPDGGRLPEFVREDIKQAMVAGLHVDCGLHDFLSEDGEMAELARQHDVQIRDVRKPPPRSELHGFTGKIEEVTSLKVAVLGTDSAVGKRTTAWILVDALTAAGHSAELIGTGQTAWMQGARYGIILDSLINDFVSGEIEHAVWTAWREARPAALVLEGQGSLMNPAYPGGYEILAAARPEVVVLQHAPARVEYDGFPGYAMHPLDVQIQAIELISGKPVVAVAINHEGLSGDEIPTVCAEIEKEIRRPVCDVLTDGADRIVQVLLNQPHVTEML
jgi:uncharacterized NAD-dependent epimerase/dehydratase family protein